MEQLASPQQEPEQELVAVVPVRRVLPALPLQVRVWRQQAPVPEQLRLHGPRHGLCKPRRALPV